MDKIKEVMTPSEEFWRLILFLQSPLVKLHDLHHNLAALRGSTPHRWGDLDLTMSGLGLPLDRKATALSGTSHSGANYTIGK